MAAPFDPPLEAAEVLDALESSYREGTKIFTGGQATVFRACTPGGHVHALKIYFPDPDAYVDERTDREVSALRALRIETLVALEADGHVVLRGTRCRYVATSFIDGESVRNRLKAGTPLPFALVAKLGIDIARAIEALWSLRIVHRDVTPNNVMVTTSGRAVLINLGLARHTALASLSRPNEGWGTMGYLSPEQNAATRALTCKSDVFALGVLLQECLRGQHPTQRDQRRLIRGLPATSTLAKDLPGPFCDVVDAMVRLQPPLRPGPRAVALALEPFTKGE